MYALYAHIHAHAYEHIRTMQPCSWQRTGLYMHACMHYTPTHANAINTLTGGSRAQHSSSMDQVQQQLSPQLQHQLGLMSKKTENDLRRELEGKRRNPESEPQNVGAFNLDVQKRMAAAAVAAASASAAGGGQNALMMGQLPIPGHLPPQQQMQLMLQQQFMQMQRRMQQQQQQQLPGGGFMPRPNQMVNNFAYGKRQNMQRQREDNAHVEFNIVLPTDKDAPVCDLCVICLCVCVFVHVQRQRKDNAHVEFNIVLPTDKDAPVCDLCVICVYVCLYISYVCISVCVCVYVCVYIYIYIYIYACVLACVCMPVRTHAHAYTHIKNHPHKRTPTKNKPRTEKIHLRNRMQSPSFIQDMRMPMYIHSQTLTQPCTHTGTRRCRTRRGKLGRARSRGRIWGVHTGDARFGHLPGTRWLPGGSWSRQGGT
jgi:hypothetical protein